MHCLNLTEINDLIYQLCWQVTLNGNLLELVNNLDIPDLNPTEKEAGKGKELPTLSFGFYVFKDANANACIKSSHRSDQ